MSQPEGVTLVYTSTTYICYLCGWQLQQWRESLNSPTLLLACRAPGCEAKDKKLRTKLIVIEVVEA